MLRLCSSFEQWGCVDGGKFQIVLCFQWDHQVFRFQVQRLSVKVIIEVNRLQHEKVYKAQLTVYVLGKIAKEDPTQCPMDIVHPRGMQRTLFLALALCLCDDLQHMIQIAHNRLASMRFVSFLWQAKFPTCRQLFAYLWHKCFTSWQTFECEFLFSCP